jgi:hypothetical protein
MRPAGYDATVAIGERKPVYADSEDEARQLVAAMPAVTIGGHSHKPTLIESLSPASA